MNDVPDDCICRRLLDLGIVEAVENAAHRDEIFIAIQACLDKGSCNRREPVAATDETAPAAASAPNGTGSRRKRSDRRSGTDRRQTVTAIASDRERRDAGERRSGGDRRGLLAGEQYTPQQAVLNLRAWCNGHCRGTFDLRLDTVSGELRFHFDDPDDRAGFTRMLQKFKGLTAPPG
ncbi:MAG: hypothetical protein WD075_05940 [Rhodospirillales bacterium]